MKNSVTRLRGALCYAVAAAAAVLILTISCQKTEVAKTPTSEVARTTIFVNVADDGKVDIDAVKLSWKKDQRIVWVTDSNNDFEIQFDEVSPFGNNPRKYDLSHRGSCYPGPITKKSDDDLEHHYRYNVVVKGATSTGAKADPDVIITRYGGS